MVNLIKKIIGSRYFLATALILFIVQGIWYATSIKHGIPADETYHYKFIEYYTNQPINTGPIISDQGDNNFYLGDVQRVPSYLYHYILSFPNKLLGIFELSTESRVIALRLVNLFIGLLSILTLRRILKFIKIPAATTNIVLSALIVTGMFTWVSSSINYDNLLILLFFNFVYYLVSFIDSRKITDLLLIGIFAISSILTKVFIGPTILISLIFGAYFLFKKKSPRTSLINTKLRPNTFILLSLSTLFVITTVLFSERIIGNMISFGTVTPKCDQIHTTEQCLQNGIFNRDYNYIQSNQTKNTALPLLEVDIPHYIVSWSNIMYERLYFFFGHKTIHADEAAKNAKVALIVFIVLGLMLKGGSAEKNKYESLLFAITILYIAQLFILNFSAFIQKGAVLGGYQGRYLLPIIPFLYLFIVRSLISVRYSLNRVAFTVFTAVGLIVALWFSYKHFPPYVFIKETDSSWYTETSQNFNTNLKEKLNLD